MPTGKRQDEIHPRHSSLQTCPSSFPYWRKLRPSWSPRQSNQGAGSCLQRSNLHLGAPSSLTLKNEQLQYIDHPTSTTKSDLYTFFSSPFGLIPETFNAPQPTLPPSHPHIHGRKICNVSICFIEAGAPCPVSLGY